MRFIMKIWGHMEGAINHKSFRCQCKQQNLQIYFEISSVERMTLQIYQ